MIVYFYARNYANSMALLLCRRLFFPPLLHNQNNITRSSAVSLRSVLRRFLFVQCRSSRQQEQQQKHQERSALPSLPSTVKSVSLPSSSLFSTSAPSSSSRFHSILIVTRDVDAAEEFFRVALGLKVYATAPNGNPQETSGMYRHRRGPLISLLLRVLFGSICNCNVCVCFWTSFVSSLVFLSSFFLSYPFAAPQACALAWWKQRGKQK